jgi:hypothetical protein
MAAHSTLLDHLAGSDPAGLSRAFGTWQDRSIGETYRAETDGFVSAGLLPPADASDFCFGVLTGRVDGRMVSCTTSGNFGSFDANWNSVRASGTGSLLMPVPSGSLWEVDCIAHPRSKVAPAPWALWMPIGAATDEMPRRAIGNDDSLAISAQLRPWQDFEPALLDLTLVLERILGRALSESDRLDLLRAIRQLI